MLGQLERQHPAVTGDQLARLRQGGRHGVGVAQARHDQLERHELVERKTPPSLLGLVVVDGEMDRGERVPAQGQLELRRQRIGKAPRVVRERCPDELAQSGGRDLLAGRIDGRVVGRPARLADVIALHVEAVAAELAA